MKYGDHQYTSIDKHIGDKEYKTVAQFIFGIVFNIGKPNHLT